MNSGANVPSANNDASWVVHGFDGNEPLRVAAVSLGDRFDRCPECGLRCKRGETSQPWREAEGPDDLTLPLVLRPCREIVVRRSGVAGHAMIRKTSRSTRTPS